MAPITNKQWIIAGRDGFDNLKFEEIQYAPIVSDNDVFVKFHAASLNYRDAAIFQGKYPFQVEPNVVAGSDGAAEVISVGPKVTLFKPGDRVTPILFQKHQIGPVTPEILASCVGTAVDGTLRQFGVFNETALVSIPKSLSWGEGATLSCAALTAWNALFGFVQVKAGDFVLTQGTGGVSIFALQFAVLAGATVVATTSSSTKADLLRKLGANHVINYKDNPEWGQTAKDLTPGGRGFDNIIEIGGPTTLAQSLKAIRMEGLISKVGAIAGPLLLSSGASAPDYFPQLCTERTVVAGSKVLFEDMNRFIEEKSLKPVIDAKKFKLEDIREAYQYLHEQKHVGKIVIDIE